MRLSNDEHDKHAWRISEVAPDFRLEDVWALPAQGGAGDFAALLEVMASLNPADWESRAARALFAVRWTVGGWLGWDDAPSPLPIPDDTRTTLSARLPADLRGSVAGSDLHPARFTPLYCTDVEWAGEISNRTVHAIMHLAWVDRGGGRYEGQMGVYVKPRGAFGEAYMALIAPFRHRVVYPTLMREIRRAWNARTARTPGAAGLPHGQLVS
jgi:hypothetical protein